MSNLPLPLRRADLADPERRLAPEALPLESGIGLDECWRVLRRHSRMITTMVLLAVSIAGTAVFLMTPQYTATSTLLIEPEPPQVLDVKQLVSASVGTEDHDYYKTQFELLRSRDLADRVISELDLARNRAFNSAGLGAHILGFFLAAFASSGEVKPMSAGEVKQLTRFDIVNRYLGGLKIKPVAGTRLVTVSYTASDRDLAARIVDRHVHDYVQEGIELRHQAGKSAREFLATQLVEIGHRVQDSEAALNAYRHKTGIIAFGIDEKNSVAAQRMFDLNKALTAVETNRMNAEAEWRLVRSGDFDSLPEVVTNPAITALTPEVRRLQADYARLSVSFKPGYPKLDEIRAQMLAGKKALNAEIADVASAIQRRYTAALSEEKRLKTAIESEKEKDLAIDDASLRDAVLVREVETNRQLYKNVLKRMQEMEVTEQAPLSNIGILDNAVVSRFPSNPKKLRDLAIAALFALFIGVGLAFYADQLDSSLRSIEEVEHFLQLPGLAIIPDFSRLVPFMWRFGLTQRQAVSPELAGHNYVASRGKYVAGRAESYRIIRTSLLFVRPGCPPQTIVVSSAISGEGKTLTAANTARAFAQTGASTLLIDADLRRPHCHSLVHERNEFGLSDVLEGRVSPQQAIRPTAINNLSVLTAGSRIRNPAELLISDEMREVLASVHSQYEMVLVDTAPVMLASDSAALGTMVDGVLLIVGGDTPRETIKRACQRFEYVGARMLGVVLNRVNIRDPAHDELLRYYLSYGLYETDADGDFVDSFHSD